jgi:membrane associated rhomboid family serine protease
MTKTVKMLIIINVAVFVLIQLFPGFAWFTLFGLVPRYVFGQFRIWQLLTYMFLHAGLFHLLVNMLMLWFFAPAVERAWGRRQFLYYYFFTGIGAGLCSFLTAFRSPIPVVGASGAIFAILVAYALMYPETTILFFFIFPMKIRHAVLVLAGINLLGALSEPNAGVAYFAHLGGGVLGYLYLKSEWLRWRISQGRLFNFPARQRQRKEAKKQLQKDGLDQKTDAILDKISKYGIKSLTREERRILELKSKKGGAKADA